MRFGLLGATQAWDADRGAVAVGGPGRRAALALLALDAGRIVTVQRMIDGLYGEDPPAGVGNALQSQISRLRGALRGAGRPELIENHPAGYRLAVDPDHVDAHRFARLAAQGRDTLAAGDPAKAADLLRDALALWRGPALADVGDAPFAGPQTVRLEEQRLAATEDRIQAELELGDHRTVISELRELVSAHPLRERLSAQLVRALHGSGQQAEALAAFAETREALADALGADPGPELAAAHLAVLRGEPDAFAPPPSGIVRGVAALPAARHLAVPAQLSGLIGRERELARIVELLHDGRLVTLTGPGGTGKTRTAVEAAARHPGDSCFADLSGLGQGDDLPQAVLSALGLRSSGLLGSGEGPTPMVRLTAALTERPLLLVLDNCEHLVADAARLAVQLLAACPELRVLATSREPLGITGERLLPLPPLPEAAAIQLFAERALAVHPGFDPEQDADTVAEICRRLDGLPLAIELAAARLRMLSPRQIAERLDDRFRLLTGGSRTAQPRQQTLRAVVDWSWDLLPETERAALRRASVFSGGWTLEAGQTVCCDGSDDVLELIGALVDKSLVVAQQEEADGEVRYRLLQTVRAYAAERLAESDEAEHARQAHLRFFLDLATTANPRLRTADQLRWLRRLTADHDNLHAALRGADTLTALRMIGELSGYWMLRGLRFEGAPHARKVLEELGPHPAPGLEEEYAICLMLAATTPNWREELAPQLAVTEALMRNFRRTPRRNPALTLLWAPFTGVPEEMDQLTPAEVAQWRADPWSTGLIHVGDGFRHLYVTADAASADREFTAAVEQFRSIGDRWGQIIALGELANIADWRGDHGRSEGLAAESLRLAAELGAAEDIAELVCARAERRVRAGELDAAVADCEQAIGLFRRVGAPDSVARARLCLADIARLRGDLSTARELCASALAASPPGSFSGDWLRISVLVELGRIAEAEPNAEAARAYYREALPHDVDHRNLPALAIAAEAVAGLGVLEGEPGRAAYLLGVSRALRRNEAPADADQLRTTGAALAALGRAGYDRTHAEGAALRVEDAVRALTDEAQRRSVTGQ
ncbi:putative ATPase/DNA-binding SARP family transcriptional activator [Streptacidiphilus sp. MAP12-16]|uniref:BTAD domain-containing putative transcriptional regulator n=1 Tax=Streptacidiphilus sp. MAP12-16 TaxID=3156300 RepID=UPI003514F83B